MSKVYSLIHDHCAHRSWYMVQWTGRTVGGWTWHRTYSGALRSQAEHGGRIYKILGTDHTELVWA